MTLVPMHREQAARETVWAGLRFVAMTVYLACVRPLRRISIPLRRLGRRLSDKALRLVCSLQSRVHALAAEPESGAATAEYAVVLIAATAFAGLLLAILKSGTARELLLALVKRALSVA